MRSRSELQVPIVFASGKSDATVSSFRCGNSVSSRSGQRCRVQSSLFVLHPRHEDRRISIRRNSKLAGFQAWGPIRHPASGVY